MSEFRRSTPQRKGSYRFPRRSRLARKADIDRVRQEGRRVRSEFMDVRTLASPLSYPRVAVVVPRFSRTIVERNRLRRRLRELVRTLLLPSLPPQDVLLRTNPAAYRQRYDALEREIRSVASRLGAV